MYEIFLRHKLIIYEVIQGEFNKYIILRIQKYIFKNIKQKLTEFIKNAITLFFFIKKVDF